MGPSYPGRRFRDRGSVYIVLRVVTVGAVVGASLLTYRQLVGGDGSTRACAGFEQTDISVTIGIGGILHPARRGTVGGTIVLRNAHAHGAHVRRQEGSTGIVRVGRIHDHVAGNDAASCGGGAAGACGGVRPNTTVSSRYKGKRGEGQDNN